MKKQSTKMDNKSIELIREKSKDILDAQIQSYRSIFSKAGTIVAVLSIYFPILLLLIDKSLLLINIILIIPTIMAINGLIKMLQVLISPKLRRGFKNNRYNDLMKLKINDLMKYDTKANMESFNKNEELLNIKEDIYKRGINSTIYSIVISMILFFISTIYMNI